MDQQLRGLEGLKLKIRLYRSGVVSKLTHCHEVWKLDTACIATLELFNACCLQAMTGLHVGTTYREETVDSPTFDLIAWLRSGLTTAMAGPHPKDGRRGAAQADGGAS